MTGSITTDWFPGLPGEDVHVGDVHVFARTGGRADGPPVLLLHGFPQTHAMWHRVAVRLAPHARVVLADLPGYGDSAAPAGAPDHSTYSKRTMAADLVELMRRLGHDRFTVIGHDRGGRVGHRMALDHPDAVEHLAVLDIAPTLDMYAATDARFATAYHHWFHLIQPEPLPERMIGGDPLLYLHAALGGWGARDTSFVDPRAMAEYERCFRRPEVIHAVCEDYRAAATIDLDHDRASRTAGRRVRCDLTVLWGERGLVHARFDPVRLWQAQCAGRVTGHPLPCGHFLAEELPDATADLLLGLVTRPAPDQGT